MTHSSAFQGIPPLRLQPRMNLPKTRQQSVSPTQELRGGEEWKGRIDDDSSASLNAQSHILNEHPTARREGGEGEKTETDPLLSFSAQENGGQKSVPPRNVGFLLPSPLCDTLRGEKDRRRRPFHYSPIPSFLPSLDIWPTRKSVGEVAAPEKKRSRVTPLPPPSRHLCGLDGKEKLVPASPGAPATNRLKLAWGRRRRKGPIPRRRKRRKR